jgi:membrane fusion protein (multidrug efflux system)
MRTWVAAAVIVSISTVLAGCRERTEAQAAPHTSPAAAAPTVQVIRPRDETLRSTVRLSGTAQALYRVDVYSRVTGYVTEFTLDRGDRVRKGQVIARIDVPDMPGQLEHAHAVIASADADLAGRQARDRRLRAAAKVSADAVAATQLEESAAALDEARGRLTAAQAELRRLQAVDRDATLTAPFDAVITNRFVDPGALVDATTSSKNHVPLVTLEAIDTIRVFVDVPELNVTAVRPGTTVRLAARALEGRTFDGRVSRISSSLDLSTRTMRVEIDLPNRDHAVLPGMDLVVRLDLGEHPHALTLPAEVIQTDADGTFVWIIRNGQARRQRIRVGNDTGSRVEVTEGITAGDAIVLSGAALIEEGRSVNVQDVAS